MLSSAHDRLQLQACLNPETGVLPMTTTKDIHHTVRIKAKPSAVYEALMDSKKHTAFTGAPAKISRAIGGPFTAHGPHLKGINVDLTRNKRIVQAWRAAGWPKGHYSIVTFDLKPTKTGTVLDFTHVGIPAQRVKSIDFGWKNYYWKPLKAALEK
jgi:activator of HSP90 ATPase